MIGRRPVPKSPDVQLVYDLAREIGAKIHTSERNLDRARSTPDTREVFVSKPDAATEGQWFWTTLHELGHVANSHIGSGLLMMFGGPTGRDRVAEQEAQAWTWAVDHAGRPLDEEGRGVIAATLTSYLQDPIRHIGPNLRRIFQSVGPNPDTRIMRQVEPTHWDLAIDIWTREYPHITGEAKLAA
jgi:hypothetical protein